MPEKRLEARGALARGSERRRLEATLAHRLAERLRSVGVRRAYGFPGGGSNLDLLEAFEAVGITWVLSHTEGGAAFMACADAEINRVPGALLVGNGPGLTSAVNGVAHASLDRVPLIVVSDRYTVAEATTTGHQVLDQRALLAPVVKLSATLDGSDVQLIDRAIGCALSPPRGPVHFDVPRDAAGRETAALDQDEPMADESRGIAVGDELESFAEALRQAACPVVLVGLEANDHVAPEDLLTIVRNSAAAVMTTYKAKGAYPERDERWAGILTGGELERPVLERADVVLAVGLDSVELLARPWPYTGRVISLAAHERTDRYLRPQIRRHGAVATSVSDLARLLSRPRVAGGFPEEEIAALRDAGLARLRVDSLEPLPGWRVVETVMAELPDRSTIAVDAGAHMLPTTCFARPSGPRRFLISNGLATMGFAVPAAVGAALARPEEIAVAFTGDGGMAYHADELETARRMGVRVLVVVFNDSSLSLIRIKHEAKGYGRRPLDFGLTRFDRVAQGLGACGVSVTTADMLRTEVREALRRPCSTVIDVRTTGREYARTLTTIRGG